MIMGKRRSDLMKTMIPVMMAAGLMSCAHVAPPQIIKPAQLASEAALATNAIPAEMLPADCFLPYSPSDYKLAIGDVVEVAVFGFSDTIASLPIAPDGKLYYMFGDGVPAAGLKPEVVAGIIQGGVRKPFNNAQDSSKSVTVRIDSIILQYILNHMSSLNAWPNHFQYLQIPY